LRRPRRREILHRACVRQPLLAQRAGMETSLPEIPLMWLRVRFSLLGLAAGLSCVAWILADAKPAPLEKAARKLVLVIHGGEPG